MLFPRWQKKMLPVMLNLIVAFILLAFQAHRGEANLNCDVGLGGECDTWNAACAAPFACHPSPNFFQKSTCNYCPRGYYPAPCSTGFNAPLNECVLCAAGYGTNEGDTTCHVCGPGWFSAGDGVGCQECPVGTYTSLTKSTKCFDCPVNNWTPFPGAASCEPCQAGTDTRGTTRADGCDPCGRGRTSIGDGKTGCFDCSAGMYALDGYSPKCLTCPGGYVNNSPQQGRCYKCPAGTASEDSLTECSACGPGSYAPAGATRCLNCPPGSATPNAKSVECTACPRGTIPNEDRTTCVPCPQGYITNATAPHLCTPCPNGFTTSPEGGDAGCLPCPTGFSTLITPNVTAACTLCPNGTFSVIDLYTGGVNKTALPVGLDGGQNFDYWASGFATLTAPPDSSLSPCVPCIPGSASVASSLTCRNPERKRCSSHGAVYDYETDKCYDPCPAGTSVYRLDHLKCISDCLDGWYVEGDVCRRFDDTDGYSRYGNTDDICPGTRRCEPGDLGTCSCFPVACACKQGYYAGFDCECNREAQRTISDRPMDSVPPTCGNATFGAENYVEMDKTCYDSDPACAPKAPTRLKANMSCTSCPPGSKSDLESITVPAAWKNFEHAQRVCNGCGAGGYSTHGGRDCASCPPGTYSNNVAGIGSECVTCTAKDTRSTSPGRSICTLPCSCGFNWTSECNQRVSARVETEVYLDYVKTLAELPMRTALTCSLLRAIDDPTTADDFLEVLSAIENATAHTDWKPDVSLYQMAKDYADVAKNGARSTAIAIVPFESFDTLSTLAGGELDILSSIDLSDTLAQISFDLQDGFKALEVDIINATNFLYNKITEVPGATLQAINVTIAATLNSAEKTLDRLDRQANEIQTEIDYYENELTFKKRTIEEKKILFQQGVGAQLAIDLISLGLELLTAAVEAFQGKFEADVNVIERNTALTSLLKAGETVSYLALQASKLKDSIATIKNVKLVMGGIKSLYAMIKTSINLSDKSELYTVRNQAQELNLKAYSQTDSLTQANLDLQEMGLSYDAALSGYCGGTDFVVQPCNEYRQAIKTFILYQQAIFGLYKSLSDCNKQYAATVLQVLAAQQTLQDLRDVNKAWVQSAKNSSDWKVSNYELVRREAFRLADQAQYARGLVRFRTGLSVITRLLQMCNLARYKFPAFYNETLCEVGINNLSPAKPSPGTGNPLKDAVDTVIACYGSKWGADAGGVVPSNFTATSLSLARIGAQYIPGLPVDLENFKVTRTAAFTLDQNYAAWFINDTTQRWQAFTQQTQRMRLLGVSVWVEGLVVKPQCLNENQARVQIKVQLTGNFKQRFVTSLTSDSWGDEYTYEYVLADQAGFFTYLQKLDLPDWDCKEREVDPDSPGGSACTKGALKWGVANDLSVTTIKPTPFAEWKITLADDLGCFDLSNITDIKMSLDLEGFYTSSPAKNVTRPVVDPTPEEVAARDVGNPSYVEFRGDAVANRLGVCENRANSTLVLCTFDQLCANTTYAQSRALIIQNTLYGSTRVPVKDAKNWWVEIQGRAEGSPLCKIYKNESWGMVAQTREQDGFIRDIICCDGVSPRSFFEPVGCFQDGDGGARDLPVCVSWDDQRLTPGKCIAMCAVQGYSYSGVQGGQACFCGNSYGSQKLSTSCNTTCTGDASVTCGGASANMIYSTASLNVSATKNYLGCFFDPGSIRDLSWLGGGKVPNLTVEACVANCAWMGFRYAGLQFGQECWCDNNYGNSSTTAKCDMRCTGNDTQICGGIGANSVYEVALFTGLASAGAGPTRRASSAPSGSCVHPEHPDNSMSCGLHSEATATPATPATESPTIKAKTPSASGLGDSEE